MAPKISNRIRASCFPTQVQKNDVQQIEQKLILERRRLPTAARQAVLNGLGGYSLRHQTLSQSCLEGLPVGKAPAPEVGGALGGGGASLNITIVRARCNEQLVCGRLHRGDARVLFLGARILHFRVNQIPFATQTGLATAVGRPSV